MSMQSNVAGAATGLRAYAPAADLTISPLPLRAERARPQVGTSSENLRTEPGLVRFIIIALTITFLSVFVVLPLVVVFAQAFSKGAGAYFSALAEPEALSAIRLTLLVAAISVSLNLLFGVVAAWAIAKFDFAGKTILITLIDLPFSVSPVISGLVFVLLFGGQGLFGPWLQAHNVHLRVGGGELLALLGPSGSGKTTVLRIVAGLEWRDAGEISFDGENALS